MNKLILPLLSFVLNVSVLATPVEIIVTPSDLQGWANVNDRDDSAANITIDQPRSGDGSLQFTTTFVTATQDKTDFQLDLDPATFPNRTLNNLSDLSFEYYRDSTNTAVAAHFHPTFRLGWYNDAGTPLDLLDDTKGFLIYEEIYNGVPSVTEDSWVTKTIIFNTDHFWMFCNPCAGGTGVVPIYTHTLQDWKAGPPAHALSPTNFSIGTTLIYAVNVGIGSGWNNNVLMNTDNIRIAFGENDDFRYNFEVSQRNNNSNSVPVPMLSNFGLFAMFLFILSIGIYYKRKNT